MAVTITNRVQLSPATWIITYESDLGGTPTFYVWVNGAFVDETEETTVTVNVSPGRYTQIDIFDDSGDSPGNVFPDSITLQWLSRGGVVEWKVYEIDITAAETLIRTMVDNGGVMKLEYPVNDGDWNEFRIDGFGPGGEESTSRQFLFDHVGLPQSDANVITYDEGTLKFVASAP